MITPHEQARVEPPLTVRPTAKRPRSYRVVISALIADGLVAAATFVAAAESGSGGDAC